jgi:putative hydrolase of the HAD superfamily
MTRLFDIRDDAIDAVMFDLDDTLLDHSSAATSGAQELARTLGRAADVDAFVASWKAHSADAYPRYLCGELTYDEMRHVRMQKSVDPNLSREAALKLFDLYAAAYQAAWLVFDDVPACLQASSSLKLGVITNGRAVEQRAKLRVIKIDAHFHHVGISEEFGQPKPEAAIFLDACARLNVRPDRTLYVGDNHKVDFLGAQDSGLHALWLNRKAKHNAPRTVGEIASLTELWQPA